MIERKGIESMPATKKSKSDTPAVLEAPSVPARRRRGRSASKKKESGV
jgi:hypothetical protein